MALPVEPRLRPARPGDADVVVPLLLEALDVLALELAGVDRLADAAPVFRRLFADPHNRYSHRLAWVLEQAGQPQGVILAYPGREETGLMEATRHWLQRHVTSHPAAHQRESRPDEFYLDALALHSGVRGQGLAGTMIEALCDKARDSGQQRVGLLVDHAKPGVRRLYEKLGFAIDGEREVAGHHYHHMSRAL